VADVMGHGVRSALVTAMLRALVEEIGAAKADPGEFLTELNRELTAILSQTGDMMFATAFYVIVDRSSATVRYSRAGHPCPVILRRALQTTEIMECRRPLSGPGLCVFESARYGTAELPLSDDDVILMFTDGLIEAAEGEGEPFGVEGLQQVMLRHADLGVDELVGEIFGAAGQFVHGTPFEDDLCLVGINFLTPRPAGTGRNLDLARADTMA
jgi:serine phosphatase RsbU (regulator of sigma subunit)